MRMKRTGIGRGLVLFVAGLAPLVSSFAQVGALVPGARAFSGYAGRAVGLSSGAIEGFGYFTFVDGIPGPYFAGAPGEATAFFTFRTGPINFPTIVNNGSVLFAPAQGPTFNIYFNPAPKGDWNNPDSFSGGQLIATFKRAEGIFMCNGDLTLLNTCSLVISGKLASSADFNFNGATFNYNRLVPFGETDIISMIDTSYPGFAAVYVGYELAIGGGTED